MPKTNFTKVEEALNEGLRKMTVNHLLDLADLAASVDKRPKILPDNTQASKEVADLQTSRNQLIVSINRDLKMLSKHDEDLYKKLGFKRKDLKKFLDHPDSLSPEEWDKIKEIKEQVSKFRTEIMKNVSPESNEEIVELERKKHINKRFNVNDKWLPLK